MLPRCLSQQVNEAPRLCGRPASRRRLTSYRPMARKGPTRKQPETKDMVYWGRLRNTAPSTRAINQKQVP